MQIIHQGKLNLLANGAKILSSRPADTLASAPEDAPAVIPLIDGMEGNISTDAIWACTTCGACMEKCPVFIEHVPKLLWMRRHLVMEKAAFPEELIGFFENSEQRFNPWGIAPSERDKWVHDRNTKILSHGARVEYLFFVGCSGAFDSRNRQVTLAKFSMPPTFHGASSGQKKNAAETLSGGWATNISLTSSPVKTLRSSENMGSKKSSPTARTASAPLRTTISSLALILRSSIIPS